MYRVTDCSTTARYDRSIIKWTIDELSIIKIRPGKRLCSKLFSTCAGNNRNTWKLILTNHTMWLALLLNGDAPSAVTVKYEIYIVKRGGEKKIVQRRKEHTFDPTGREKDKEVFGPACDITKEIILFKEASKVEPEYNKIRFWCEVLEIGLTTAVVNKRKSKKSVFIDDYKYLWNTKDAADIMLLVGDEQFKAHKIVLIARSPVFRAMFTNNTQEKDENIINITDMDADVIKAVLEYMYTDTVKELDGVAFDLLAAADKYQLNHLKSLCEESLTKAIAPSNVMQLLVWADRHHSEQLVQDLIEFFKKEEGKKLTNTAEFEDMSKLYPHLLLQIFRNSQSK